MLHRPSLKKNRSDLIELNTKSSRQSGFALVVALSLMAFILLLLLSIVTFVQVETHSSATSKQQLESRQAALLSLNMAIGKLQEQAGHDQRVTAPVAAVAGVQDVERSKKLTGVWRAWEGLNHDKSTGLPAAPDYSIKLSNGELAIDSVSQGRFLSWLTSSFDEAQKSGASVTITDIPSTAEGTGTVPLLAKGTLGVSADSEDEVHIRPTVTLDGNAGLAWWIQGDNTKVRLKPVEEPSADFDAMEQMLVSPGPSGADFDINDTSTIERVASRDSLNLVAAGASSEQPSEFFHDLSIYSKGLLTNTANGGWRRDLSLWSENFSGIGEGFSSFTLSPGEVWEAGKFNRTSATNPLIYSWSNWSRSPFQNSVSWAALADFATQYKQLNTSGLAAAEIDDSTAYQRVDGNQQWELADSIRRMPVIARIHTVMSLSARPVGADYQPSVILNPVITMWNPYDVALDMSWRANFRLNLIMGSPFAVRFDLGGSESVRNVNQLGVQTITIPTGSPTSTWLPGEVRVFSPTGGGTIESETGNVNYEVGCDPTGGMRYNIPGLPNASGTTTLSATEALQQAIHNGPNVQGTGVYYTLKRASSRITRPPNTANASLLLDDIEEARDMLGENLRLSGVSGTLESLSRNPRPFLTMAMSMRFARDVNGQMDNIVVNGIHNMNPTTGYVVSADDAHNLTPLLGRFDVYPYNVLLFSVNSFTDPEMPSGIAEDPEGYLGSGFGSRDGLSNLILTEVPTSPLRTIGDLQHFNVSKCNSWGPYTLNALGNSRTSPFIDSDKIRVSMTGGGAPVSRFVGHDHSYAINHLLLDDWFVSSVAPDPDAWSIAGGRTTEQVYRQHLSGEEPLANHYYQARRPLSASDASSEASSFLSDNDAWLKIAAELEVDGMFNINSTSERAWAMLLKRNFFSDDPGVLRLDSSTAGSGSVTVSLEESDGSPFPRTRLISDENAGALGFSSLSQHQRFTDLQINALAREIVAEIKKRGPFLSLSEFFNRQLSNDVELARAGAVESALLTLSELTTSENPYADLLSIFPESDVSTGDTRGAPLDYPFPEAAEGSPAYGFPGWTRQADVLRPVSGILSARDDTFTIRAYGDVRDPVTNEVVSRSWCEAVVQRKADYVDGDDDLYVLPSEDTLSSEINKRFGRRFEIINFRWLEADEV